MKVDEIPFEIRVILGELQIPLESYSELQLGDILILNQKINEPLPIRVNEESLFLGHPGIFEKWKGIKIKRGR
jgi:flagellar motor switch protein FliM